MIVIKDTKIERVHESVRHGFFGRQGGVSHGLYDSLNCVLGSSDESSAVQENRRRVVETLVGDVPMSLVTLAQVHSATCVLVDESFDGESHPEADALVTDRANLVLGVLTADCGCVLLAGKKADGSPVIGAAHAGWRGAVGGVLAATVEQMLTLGTALETLQASIGPCIAQASYEVSEGFEKPFLAQEEGNERFFMSAQRKNHLLFDLAGYIAYQLFLSGVKNVTITGHDTYAEPEKFFSYRYATHRKEEGYGRQISVIMIEK